ncbi:MAG: hypothetical protein DRH37_06330 [Deltaproteobacteria bacterium]|nr:MAG: hypothetical protein DRH37_06330 [Deltaproteobacteria bacterium]
MDDERQPDEAPAQEMKRDQDAVDRHRAQGVSAASVGNGLGSGGFRISEKALRPITAGNF